MFFLLISRRNIDLKVLIDYKLKSTRRYIIYCIYCSLYIVLCIYQVSIWKLGNPIWQSSSEIACWKFSAFVGVWRISFATPKEEFNACKLTGASIPRSPNIFTIFYDTIITLDEAILIIKCLDSTIYILFNNNQISTSKLIHISTLLLRTIYATFTLYIH